jgi:hypothetical protein
MYIKKQDFLLNTLNDNSNDKSENWNSQNNFMHESNCEKSFFRYFDNLDQSEKSNSNDLPQYSSLYLKRLEITKKKLLEDCKKKWPKVHICKNILDLKGNVIINFIIFFEFLERANYNWAHI